MSAFDPAIFEETVIEAANQESYVPVPEADYQAYIDSYGFKTPKDSVILDINWIVPDDNLAEQLGMEEVGVRQSIFLDVTDGGALDFGTNKNVRLGRLRAALGLNDAGKPFQFAMLNSQRATIAVTQRPDKNDASIIYNDVAKVSAPA